ncbi:MAG: hypothetical protein ISS65_10215 [Desulfobacterales bacterium]|uniref:Uncharacterized protein n=1 Tax=Candidatus Desulfatibia profunda TaxID=2841695 RepID=A0A8J6NVM0_9BACT|nr:hypothetical protein [Candidatus Desulfatibia profunda]MBL7180564.1 hypothetical protein [Desulfobacterales bacterium]
MKITNHDVIKSGEQELIDAITADLDWGTIEEIFSKEHKLKIDDNVEYKKGDIVVFNGQIAYKLEFDVTVVLAILLDREGNYLSVTSSGDLNTSQEKNDEGTSAEPEESEDSYESALSEFDLPVPSEINDTDASSTTATNPQEKISKLASQAGELISEIEDKH